MVDKNLKKIEKIIKIFTSEPFRQGKDDSEYAKGYVQGIRDAGKRLKLEFTNTKCSDF